MTFQTLISTRDLYHIYQSPNVIIFDCRFSLMDTEKGRNAWKDAHIPGAIYAHLDEDLSGVITPGKTGRHPLPTMENFVTWLSTCGVDENSQVVAYDDMSGAIASRLWWMLRWMGHDAVAVLDGGIQAWQKDKLPVDSNSPQLQKKSFRPSPRRELAVDMAEVMDKRTNPDYLVLDARGADRYRGENETIDPVPGHIPGAISAPFAQNISKSGHFLSAQELHQRFQPMQEEASSRHTIVYCGSGVTAAHNILAMAHAGLGDARLYPGSWSEWITKKTNPVATGDSVFGN